MKKNRIAANVICFVLFCVIHFAASAQSERPRWTEQQAWDWYNSKGWLVGCDFIPSTAINQLEMWQEESFDTATIDRELGYAQSLGFNCDRVYLHHVAWQVDSTGFKDRMRKYLDIADSRGIKTIFVFFDDCWNDEYKAGKQPDPKPGIHNSGWVRDPGSYFLADSATLAPVLERYVKDVMNTFRDDKRILLWDLYNEPGNSNYKSKSLPLLTKIFSWGRQVNPSQPLSSGVWNPELSELNALQLTQSDVITYHDYQSPDKHIKTIDTLKNYKRPLICTEYMARLRNSTFMNILPILKKEKIAAINWGLVSGKTNTKYAWDTPLPDGREPSVWFHEIFYPDGRPYRKNETDFIRQMTGVSSPQHVKTTKIIHKKKSKKKKATVTH